MQTSDLTPDEALARLTEGNARYVANASRHPNTDQARRDETALHGQKPFATVVGCSDSRVPLELLLDQGIGDIFVIRVAGNVCNADEIACIEYGVHHLGTPLCVVMGHTSCGAVTAVATDAPMEGPLYHLLHDVRSALGKVKRAEPALTGLPLIEHTITENVWQAIESLFLGCPVVRKQVKGGALRVIGARYDIVTGGVDWLGEHRDQAMLVG